MLTYGFFEWIFWVLAIASGVLAMARGEVFSTNSSQRVHRHAGQQIFLWIATVAFALAGFVTAVLAMRGGH
ncbi:hypothetical protein SAMN04489740_3493 [Arthrobacter alpinus]|uniref:Uncharacterized protein n=1 Tax=Arthrobacter alpinus TaxID=656366 RepID=A0A0U3PVW1_9MICC|nr:hypothetical protein [Arthrobacter alpinus]ALV46552.1 hypothetical protein MB46_14675 [Arthrobacter alpinus]SEE98004.1 hypothetical protein SAMN04489740_3493 [Arthrobacter alpinus]